MASWVNPKEDLRDMFCKVKAKIAQCFNTNAKITELKHNWKGLTNLEKCQQNKMIVKSRASLKF